MSKKIGSDHDTLLDGIDHNMTNDEYDKSRYEQLLWVEKYRPRNISDLILDDLMKDKLIKYEKKRDIPNLILTGPSGVGKTSTVKCLIRALYGKNTNHVLELNASDGGINLMCTEIENFCKKKIMVIDPTKCANFKLVIIDEADQLIDRIQPRIHLLMESYGTNVRFIFTCNTSYNIIEAIQTGCFIFRYMGLHKTIISQKIREIAKAENIKYQSNALDNLAELAAGDMRTAINMLHMVYNKWDCVNVEHIEELCDYPQQVIIKTMFDYLLKNDLHSAFDTLYALKNKGYSGSDITLGMIYALKSSLCVHIEEDIKIEMIKNVCYASYRISKGVDTFLQLASCLTDILKNIEPIIKKQKSKK